MAESISKISSSVEVFKQRPIFKGSRWRTASPDRVAFPDVSGDHFIHPRHRVVTPLQEPMLRRVYFSFCVQFRFCEKSEEPGVGGTLPWDFGTRRVSQFNGAEMMRGRSFNGHLPPTNNLDSSCGRGQRSMSLPYVGEYEVMFLACCCTLTSSIDFDENAMEEICAGLKIKEMEMFDKLLGLQV